MATHCSIFAQKIPWTEEPGELQSKGLQRDSTEQPSTQTCSIKKPFCELLMKGKKLIFPYLIGSPVKD